MKRAALAALVLGSLMMCDVAAAQDTRTVRVQFARGATSTTIHGQVAGRGTIQYRVGARAGQTMQVTFTPGNDSASFNVFAPRAVPGRDAAIFIGATSGNEASLQLDRSGDYLIQVFLVRAAARRNERANFTLALSIAGAAAASPQAPSTDARVAGTNFHATGTIPCARATGQPMGTCQFGVTRTGGGAGTMTITWPDGGNRVIFFERGAPVRYDQSQADRGARMTVRKNADLFRVTIGSQRFEIPEAVIAGG